MPFVRITGIGAYTPESVVTNQELADRMNAELAALHAGGKLGDRRLEDLLCSAQWIEERTGILERRIANRKQATSDLAVEAIRRCCGRSGYWPMDGSVVAIGTVAGDHHTTPPTAPIVQEAMGWPAYHADGTGVDRLVYDTGAACSTFGATLAQVEAFVRSGNRTDGIAVGADVMTRVTNQLVRGIAPILADGAFAMSLEATDDPAQDCFLPEGRSFYAGSDGSLADLVVMRAGGTRNPVTQAMLDDPLNMDLYIDMVGNPLFKRVVPLIRNKVIPGALEKAGLELADIGLFVFHQANMRMLEPIMKALDIRERTHNNIERYGNATSASVGLCIEEAWRKGILTPGMLVMMVVFGGGLSWVAVTLRWPDLELPRG